MLVEEIGIERRFERNPGTIDLRKRRHRRERILKPRKGRIMFTRCTEQPQPERLTGLPREVMTMSSLWGNLRNQSFHAWRQRRLERLGELRVGAGQTWVRRK